MTKLRSTIVSALALFAILRANAGTFEVRDGKFLLNGKPFQIIAGEMHYARIPREEWRQRLHMARVMGLNTISTYIFWNYHEPEQGKFDFSNNNHNLREFVREAQQESLYVILRPGPYACAEWDFGGYPAWLLKDHNLVVRSKDVKFLAACERYITRLGEEIQPLLITNGGPVIMSQVENEYGSYGSDTVYESKIRDMMIKAGFSVPLFTADGPSQCKNAHLAGVLPAINGETNPEALRDTVNKYNGGHGPYFVPEFYPGWLDHWGEEHANVPAKDFIGQYDTLIRSGASVSLYMFHGGTNFGFMNGANYGGHYQPQPTSYDYDAPLDEAGRATEKYFAFAKVLTGRVPDKSEYTVPSTMALAPVNLTESASLFEILSKPIRSDSLLSMEDMGQSYGYILYHTTLNSPLPGTLTIKDLHDYGIIFVGGDKVASLDSRHKQKKVWIPAREPHQGIDILVENGGRVNYGREILDNRKGITKSVTLEGKELKGWDIYSLPLDDISSLNFSNPKRLKPPAFYSGTFKLETCDNTFLDLRAWGKGCVWVNGYNLGRYWSIGPQQTLFLPGDWLKKGENRIVVLELEKQPPKFIVSGETTAEVYCRIIGTNSQSTRRRFARASAAGTD